MIPRISVTAPMNSVACQPLAAIIAAGNCPALYSSSSCIAHTFLGFLGGRDQRTASK